MFAKHDLQTNSTQRPCILENIETLGFELLCEICSAKYTSKAKNYC